MLALLGHGKHSEHAPVVTRYSVIWPTRYTATGEAPAKMILRSYLGDMSVDLTDAVFPLGESEMTLDVTILGGSIHLFLPPDWHARAGRVELANEIRFLGWMSDGSPPGPEEDVDRLVILNVQGWRGSLAISQPIPPLRQTRRRPRTRAKAAPPGPSDPRAHS